MGLSICAKSWFSWLVAGGLTWWRGPISRHGVALILTIAIGDLLSAVEGEVVGVFGVCLGEGHA